jgi:hypothetical protein
MAECLELANELKQKDPVALMIAKEAFWLVKLQEYPEALDVEAGKHRELHFLQQGRWVSKGIGQFLDKRYKPARTSYLNIPPEGGGSSPS